VPADAVLGEVDRGLEVAQTFLHENRIRQAASSLGAAQYCIDRAAEYAGTRRVFGKSLSTNQAVQWPLAELQTEIELLRSLIYRAAEAMIAGADMTQLATMAKLKAGKLGRELPSACLQYWGGMGFMNETPVSRAFRDGRLASIAGGADEVMLTILAKGMGTLPGMGQ